MSKNIIKIENLGKKYRIGGHEPYQALRDNLLKAFSLKRKQENPDFWALKNINLDIKEGETIGIIGANGAGKSTLLKILSRITLPTKGKIRMRGRVSSLLEVGTGFNPELTGRENIFLNGAILGMSRQEIKRKFDEIVNFSEIKKFIDTPVKYYSSGMYVRLAFAVAAHLEPEILIVDEVLAVGDANFQKKCLGKMAEVGKKGRTILFVSHNMSAIKTLCPRAILLEHGKKVFDGSSFAAVSRYEKRDQSQNALVKWTKGPALACSNLIEVGLLSCGQNKGTELSSEEPIEVYIKFKVNKVKTKIGTSVMLYNSEGIQIFTSLSNHEPKWHGRERSIGTYISKCEIPPNLLSDGTYSVSIGFWEGFYEKGIVEKDVLSFNVHEAGAIRGDLPYEISSGLIRPLLKWSSEQITKK